MTWKVFIAAIGLALVIEGVVYFALPDLSRNIIARILDANPGFVRRLGAFSVVFGLAVFWIASSI